MNKVTSGLMAISLALASACSDPEPSLGLPVSPRGNQPGILPGDPVDIDGDGVPDGIAVDIDGDGVADGVDTDGDGIADERLPDGPPLPGEEDEGPECPPDNPFCGGDGDTDPPVTCGEANFDVEPIGVNVMIAVDGSKSMNSYWYKIQEAIRDMIVTNPKLNYGMHVFYGTATDDVIAAIKAGFNFCGINQDDVLPPAANQQTMVLPFMGPQAPGQGNIYYDFTPVIDPLNYYLVNATPLEDPKTTNYLVFISDGNDNCYGTVFASKADKLLAYQKLGIELAKKNIRVLPIGFDAASAQLTALGKPRMTNFDAMDTLATFGGAGLEKALAADNVEDLAKALKTVAQRVRPCRFNIPATLDPSQNLNPFELNFFLSGKEVTRDRTRLDGWNFIDGNTSEVEFFGKSCEAIRAGKVPEARKGCMSEVCGTSNSKVSTKARAVQYLLDRSLTMNDCSDAMTPFACLPLIGNGSLSWWGMMAKAIGKSVASVVNDDVEFGLRMFPTAGADFGSCDVADKAEVDPGPSTELTIIRELLSNYPNGRTPILDALDKVADNPGRLAEAQVQGAVIVVSDGGDVGSCKPELTHEQAVARAGAAAKKLLDKGIKSYVVRFGSTDDFTAGDDEILNTIADNGGTAIVDPTNPTVHYYPAPDEAKLNEVLATISQGLSTCSFTLDELADPYVDKSKVNLYLNGQVIPFEGTQGWGWANPEQTEIQMYGQACTDFKTNRTTSLVVEFGCDPIVIL